MDEREAEDILRSAPFHQFLDLSFSEYEEGHVEIAVPMREELLVNPDRDLVHGGIVASLLDIAGHYAVLSEVDTRVPTADFRVDYLRPASSKPFTAIADVERVGSNLAVADALVEQEYKGEVQTVALGRGSYGVSHVD